MKRKSKVLALCMVLCLMVFGLVGCGNTDTDTSSESQVSGKTFVFDTYTEDGEDATTSITDMFKEQAITFNADGTCVQSIMWADALADMFGTDPVEQAGTYTEDGATVTVTLPSDEEDDVVMTFTVNGSTMSTTEDGCVTNYKTN